MIDSGTMHRPPDDFIAEYSPKEQWPENHLPGDVFPFTHPVVVGRVPVGRRWGLGPIHLEEYISDLEPDLGAGDPGGQAPTRLVTWKRVFRTDTPPGWHRSRSTTARLEGIADLGRPGPYWRHWSESARRFRKRWLSEYAGTTHRIEEIGVEEFGAAYRKSTVWYSVGSMFLGNIERKLMGPHPEAISLMAVRDIASGDIVAAMAFLHSPARKSSHYISGFMLAKHRTVPAMVGLMDYWFSYASARGWRFLSFGEFWMRGKPRSWKGFSQFKAKFGVTYVVCPPNLWRVVRRGTTL